MPTSPGPPTDQPSLLDRARSAGSQAAGAAALRARRTLRRQLTAARSSDNPWRRHAYVTARQTARAVVNSLTDRQVGWVATLWRARWLEGTRYEICGWAYERGYGYPRPPQVRVLLRRPGASTVLEADVRSVHEMEINGLARNAEFDYANTGFCATFDLAPVLADSSGEPWQVHVEVTGPDGRTRRGTLKYRHRTGSARILGARTFGTSTQVVPHWVRRRGLFLVRTHRPVMASAISVGAGTVQVDLTLDGIDLDGARAELVSAEARRPLELRGLGPRQARVAGEVPATWVVDPSVELWSEQETDEDALGPAAATESEEDVEEADQEAAAEPAPRPGTPREGQRLVPQTYRIVLVDQEGTEHVVGAHLTGGPVQSRGSGLVAYEGTGGHLYLADASAHLVVTGADLEPGRAPRLVLEGVWGGELDGAAAVLQGRRQEIPLDLDLREDGTWSGTAELYQSQWGGPAQLPRLGSYLLRVSTPRSSSVRVLTALAVIARTPEKLDVPQARLRLEVGRGRVLRLRVGLTRAPDELGSFHQRRMDAAYLSGTHTPERSIYFESFYGRLATCNPYAIDRVLARDHPGWTRYWGVTDLSVPVPEGAVPVVEGTQAWFDARARSRYVIANDWLRRRFVPQPFQTVLQTWHGSMFKRIGLDRPAVSASTREALATERDKWDVLLSQNHHSSQIFGSAYAWDGPVYEEGYPRNDPLTTGTGEQVRQLLGIREDQKAVLYAPTWRDDRKDMVVFLDLEQLTDELGDDYVILLRGHSRTVEHGGSVRQRGVVDVTTYPSITELFLAADAMITDYSSVMFDYSVTRRPMIFFVPDLDAYRDRVRGVYFDLAEVAPGPLVRTQEEVVAALRSMADQEPWAQRYEAWTRRFNALDDGHSAERVVQRLFADHPPGL